MQSQIAATASRRGHFLSSEMLKFVFGRGTSPSWPPHRDVARGPQWGPRQPPYPPANLWPLEIGPPANLWLLEIWVKGPSTQISRIILEDISGFSRTRVKNVHHIYPRSLRFGQTCLIKQFRPRSDTASDQGLHYLSLIQQSLTHQKVKILG